MPTDKVPPGWGEDSLSAFLDQAERNRHGTFHNKKAAWTLLREIDACFMCAVDGMINPKTMLGPFFLMRCHSSWRTACGAAMAGQAVETFQLLRPALEFAAYWLFIDRNPSMTAIWFERNDSEAAKKRMCEAFTVTAIRSAIAVCDAKLADVFQHLYEQSIDQGGHPNQLAIMGSTTMSDVDEGARLQQIYLHADGVVLDAALKTVVEVGICCLMILQHTTTFKARFELLGIKHRLRELRRRTGILVKKPAKV